MSGAELDQSIAELTTMTTNNSVDVSSIQSTQIATESSLAEMNMRMDAIMRGTIVWFEGDERTWWEDLDSFVGDMPVGKVAQIRQIGDNSKPWILKLPVGYRLYATEKEAEGARVLRGGS